MACGLAGDRVRMPAPGLPNHPCDPCRREWIDGRPPTDITPTLAKIVSPPRPVSTALIGRPLTRIEKIRNAAKAYWKFWRSGKALLPASGQIARRALCHGCDQRRAHKRFELCGKCECLLYFKAQLPDEHCPLGLWENGPPPAGCCGGTTTKGHDNASND